MFYDVSEVRLISYAGHDLRLFLGKELTGRQYENEKFLLRNLINNAIRCDFLKISIIGVMLIHK